MHCVSSAFLGTLFVASALASAHPQETTQPAEPRVTVESLKKAVGTRAVLKLPGGQAINGRLLSVATSQARLTLDKQAVTLRFDMGRSTLPQGEVCLQGLASDCLTMTIRQTSGAGRHHYATAALLLPGDPGRINPPNHPPLQLNPQP